MTDRSPPSFTRRLIRSVMTLAIVWVLVISSVIWMVIEHEVDELADAGLQESAELLYGMLMTNPALLGQLDPNMPSPLPAPTHEEEVTWQLVSLSGTVLLRSHQAPSDPFFRDRHAGLHVSPSQWRVYGLAMPEQAGTLYVADRVGERSRQRVQAGALAVVLTLVIGLCFAVWLRRLVRRELAPLTTFSTAVASFDPADPERSLPDLNRQELTPISKAVLDLGHRLHRRLRNERAFSAHAAHALRTPLAGMDAQLAVALRECDESMRPRLQRVRAANERLTRVVSALLLMFRTEVAAQWQLLDLGQLLDQVTIAGLDIRIHQPSTIEADPDLLLAGLINLLDNVVRHGGTTADLTVQVDSRYQVISILDNGPGIPDDKLQAINRALAQQDYESHMGLGLMLADVAARAHGGALQLRLAPSGTVLDITLRRAPRGTT